MLSGQKGGVVQKEVGGKRALEGAYSRRRGENHFFGKKVRWASIKEGGKKLGEVSPRVFPVKEKACRGRKSHNDGDSEKKRNHQGICVY